MRPRSLEEFVGQQHLLAGGRLLRRVLMGSALPSLVLWGPPGTGKTTLARILAAQIGATFAPVSAVTAGVREVREATQEAAQRLARSGQRTVLFVDEVHRFSRTQQDALLPHVETGVVILVAATTENPSFAVIAPLLSRCRVLRLEPLADDDLRALAQRALSDRSRGLGELGVVVDEDAVELLVSGAGGDARRMLGTLEVAVAMASAERAAEGPLQVNRALVEEAQQQRTLLYDKAGDEHYGVVSAFIKSMRGSDPDAAAYWMTRMLEAGEDPLFILRRMVIFAAEDVGNADPRALQVATSALAAFQFIGLPEGVLPMTQAAVYLACAPKSNTALTTYARARRAVREHGALPVPAKLRNAVTALQRELGHGREYRYPHNFSGHYVAETYLPEALSGARFYEPSAQGHEAVLAERLASWRDSAAPVEDPAPEPGDD